MTNIWMISDTHFGHNNIIKYENRPFADVDSMNKALLDNWNSLIKKNDKVFILGDFALGGKGLVKDMVGKLNGYKILILGNHDRSMDTMLSLGFNEVYKYPIIYKGFYILSHEPLYVNSNMPYVNIHGHIHSKKMESKQYYNVSVECHNYFPVKFSDIQIEYDIQNETD